MFTFETADEKEVRRFRMAQFNGRTASVKSGNQTIVGHVRSVQEQEATVPPRWTITIVPSPPKPPAAPLRPAAPRLRSVIEDLF